MESSSKSCKTCCKTGGKKRLGVTLLSWLTPKYWSTPQGKFDFDQRTACGALVRWSKYTTNVSIFSVTRYIQIASVIFAVVGLAKDYARHHFHELSGKEKIPNFWISLRALFFYLVHITCRIPSLVLVNIAF